MTAAPAHVRAIVDPRERTIARFMDKVRVDEASGCWLWTAAKDKDGYGTFQYAGPLGDGKREKRRAHRVSYDIFVGPIAADALLLHSCDTPGCVNWGHLKPGTQTENVADRVRKGRSARGETSGARQHPEVWDRIARQRSRKFSYGGEDRTLTEIAELVGVPRNLLASRVDRGWNIHLATSVPVGPNWRKGGGSVTETELGEAGANDGALLTLVIGGAR